MSPHDIVELYMVTDIGFSELNSTLFIRFFVRGGSILGKGALKR